MMYEHSVTFIDPNSGDEINSYHDFKLILAPFTPTPAEPQTNFLEVPGRDGYLDLTEANGEVKFKSREFVFRFTVVPDDTRTFDCITSEVSKALNGLRCNIRIERDSSYYWQGRCSVSEYAQDRNIGQIEVRATVDPYKLRDYPRTERFSLSANPTRRNIWVEGRMPVVPVFESSNGATIEFDGVAYTIGAGTHKIPAIRLKEGTNLIEVSGDGSLTMTYQEGEL